MQTSWVHRILFSNVAIDFLDGYLGIGYNIRGFGTKNGERCEDPPLWVIEEISKASGGVSKLIGKSVIIKVTGKNSTTEHERVSLCQQRC